MELLFTLMTHTTMVKRTKVGQQLLATLGTLLAHGSVITNGMEQATL
jgi:hypothetical protein